MPVTSWNRARLNRLFKRYNRLYWKGRLRGWHAVLGKCEHEHAYGQCSKRRRRITICVDEHPSDRELRATLLHEMAHAAEEKPGRGHGPAFFAQLERLLRMGAPITINNPEAGAARILRDIVPARFPLLKYKMDRVEARREKAIERLTQVKKLSTRTITDEDIISEFEDAALELTWKQALLCVGLENGLIDEGDAL